MAAKSNGDSNCSNAGWQVTLRDFLSNECRAHLLLVRSWLYNPSFLPTHRHVRFQRSLNSCTQVSFNSPRGRKKLHAFNRALRMGRYNLCFFINLLFREIYICYQLFYVIYSCWYMHIIIYIYIFIYLLIYLFVPFTTLIYIYLYNI